MRAIARIAFSALLATTGGAFADGMSDGKAGSAVEAAHNAQAAARLKPAKSVGGIKADRAASRDAVTDPAAAAKAYTFVGRSADGKTVAVPPSAEVVKALTGGKAAGSGREPLAKGAGIEPQGDDASRAVLGKDERIQVNNTTRYPFSAVGYLEMVDDKGGAYSCTASLIGPSTIVTAAHCLYDHEHDGDPWRDKFTFWPALAGEQSVPFAGVEYDTAYVAQGFIDNYGGNYDTVWPYDLGVITLKEPIGDTVGWFGYWHYADLGDFTANIVGYPYDKTAFTMWRTACDVLSEDVAEYDFAYTCDVSDGMQGAPVYVYDENAKARVLVGISIGDLGDRNWGLRLYQALFEWVGSINK